VNGDRTIQLPAGLARVRVRGEGPLLVWSHGVFFPIDVDDRSTLGRVLETVPGFTVARYDARGHGRTPAAATGEAHRWDRMAEDVLAIADALGAETFFAGGISMGAAVTLHAALRAPERFRGLLLFALPTAWETRPPEQQRYRELLSWKTSHALATHVRADLDEIFPAGDLPESLVAMVDELGAAKWEALSRVIEGAAESDMPSKNALKGLHVPTLIRPWPNDSGHPLSSAEGLREVLPKPTWELLEGFDDEAGMRRSFGELAGLEGPPA